MKIKTKKQLNLPQLIEWAMDNDIKHRVFESNPNFDGVTYKLGFDIGGDLYFEEPLTPTLLFTIEVEEEIDEFSDIKRLAHYTVHGFTSTNFNKSIGELRKSNSLAFYIMNDDRTLTLIWTKEKGMVE
ncbi:MAG: hypothetical protein L0L09_14345 [Staphylococcus equorum]|uniref:hypothetical protein n=1 Tax=Staphylococcus TaxID=1279 RepID=UPI0025560F1F|nr:hypothetical protein [Staphylococcus equorum]MDK9870470.1 hypothetical protein [Staphylococcus equorum]MDK9878300.1 hypothetical protein [Staphylococcus equorum]MDN6570033.1 hypothetical protein [Staphylococcus equorum]MDN6612717.1 hypothetical protein [Staphylococcus equorum]